MNSQAQRVEELRQEGLARFRSNRFEESLELFDQALELADDDETRELLVINKAGALIYLERESPEIQQLHEIVMRRRNSTHLYLAAYNLQHKYEVARDCRKALFYGRIALQAAETLGDPGRKAQVYIILGNLCVYDSKIEEAIGHYEEALALLSDSSESTLRRSFAMQNLGYCKLLSDEPTRGIEMIHTAVALMKEAGAEGFVAESYIDLCYGYLELQDFSSARHYGELGLSLATEVRQVRNAHYLLGEVAYKSGDMDNAETHFEQLATFYPDFPHLKNLLLAIDLRGLVNLKL